jgi:hypothetical protein
MKMWKSIVMVAVFVAIGALGYAQLGSAQEGKSIEQMVTDAKTPADHEALAAYYEKEAQEAHQKHAEHLQLKAAYAKMPHLASKTGLPSHCDSIAKNYDQTAKEYEALAKAHRQMATSAK